MIPSIPVDNVYSVEYWFRCLDLDGDGLLSMYEMEYFYNGVKSKMDQHNIDSMRFDDVLCNVSNLLFSSTWIIKSLIIINELLMLQRFWNDCILQLFDLIRPKQPNAVSLSDLKKCSLCTRFFNTFVNWVKYYEQEANEGDRATVVWLSLMFSFLTVRNEYCILSS